MSGATAGKATATPTLAAQTSVLEPRGPMVRRADTESVRPARFAGSLATVPASPAIQRACRECDKDDSAVRRRMAGAEELDQTEVQPRLDVGPAGDRYEREADTLAARVMAMPSDHALAGSSVPGDRIQRNTDDAESEGVKAEEADDEVRAKSSGEPLGASLGATAGQLTRGGRPLSEETRSFFERRMGRDLSQVRVHRGAGSNELNRSIRSRAFTYRNHVWLGAKEGERPSHTLAHELVHVVQQTQPATLTAEAVTEGFAPSATAPARLQLKELNAFWLPYRVKPQQLLMAKNEYHNEAAKELGKGSESMIVEAPIPGADRKSRDPTKSGFADLYMSNNDKTVGVKARSPSRREAEGLSVANFLLFSSLRKPTKGGEPYCHKEARAPKVSLLEDATSRRHGRRVLTDLGEAPTRVWIGDVKPGHSESERDKGRTQLRNYAGGIRDVVNLVNDLPDHRVDQRTAGGSRKWSMTVARIRGNKVEVPSRYKPEGRSGTRRIELWAGKKRLRTKQVFRGRMVIVEDKSRHGIWSYIWVPTSEIGPPGRASSKFNRVREQLNKVIRQLRAHPSTAKPRRRVDSQSPMPVLRGEGRVQRRATKKRPRAMTDPFRLGRWNKARRNVKKLYRALPGAERKNLEFNAGALGAAKEYQKQFQTKDGSPVRIKAPPSTLESTRNAKTIDQLAFWTGLKGRAVGYMRRIFGRAFVTGYNAMGRMKRLFTRDKRIRPAKTAHSLAKAAVIALLRVLLIVGGSVIQRTGAIVGKAIAKAAKSRVESFFDVSSPEEVEARIMQLEVRGWSLDRLSKLPEKKMAEAILGERFASIILKSDDFKAAKALFAPYQKTIAEIRKAVDLLSTASDVISIIRWAVRVVACLSPPAVGCLWIVAETAVNAQLARFIQSCWFLKKISPKLRSLQIVDSLSRNFSKVILDGLGKVLPRAVLGDVKLEIDKDAIHAVKPRQQDVEEDCKSGGRQPTQAELDYAEMFEDLSAEKKQILRDWMDKQGWSKKTRIDLETSSKFIEWVKERKSTEDLRSRLEKLSKSKNASSVVAKFKVAGDAGTPSRGKQGRGRSGSDAKKERSGAGGGDDASSGGRPGTPHLELSPEDFDVADSSLKVIKFSTYYSGGLPAIRSLRKGRAYPRDKNKTLPLRITMGATTVVIRIRLVYTRQKLRKGDTLLYFKPEKSVRYRADGFDLALDKDKELSISIPRKQTRGRRK